MRGGKKAVHRIFSETKFLELMNIMCAERKVDATINPPAVF